MSIITLFKVNTFPIGKEIQKSTLIFAKSEKKHI